MKLKLHGDPNSFRAPMRDLKQSSITLIKTLNRTTFARTCFFRLHLFASKSDCFRPSFVFFSSDWVDCYDGSQWS